jgi:hypothetical protein
MSQPVEKMFQIGAKVSRPVADGYWMNVSAQSPTTLLDSTLTADTTRQEVGVDLLKKAQDIEKFQGQALVQMLDQSLPPTEGRLDVYA